MIEDRELWACAHLLLKQHGTDAQAYAQRRAKELLVNGDDAGHRTFRRIACHIGELETVTPAGLLH